MSTTTSTPARVLSFVGRPSDDELEELPRDVDELAWEPLCRTFRETATEEQVAFIDRIMRADLAAARQYVPHSWRRRRVDTMRWEDAGDGPRVVTPNLARWTRGTVNALIARGVEALPGGRGPVTVVNARDNPNALIVANKDHAVGFGLWEHTFRAAPQQPPAPVLAYWRREAARAWHWRRLPPAIAVTVAGHETDLHRTDAWLERRCSGRRRTYWVSAHERAEHYFELEYPHPRSWTPATLDAIAADLARRLPAGTHTYHLEQRAQHAWRGVAIQLCVVAGKWRVALRSWSPQEIQALSIGQQLASLPHTEDSAAAIVDR